MNSYISWLNRFCPIALIKDSNSSVSTLCNLVFQNKIRFQDYKGANYDKWETIKLIDVCIIAKSGGTPLSTNREYYNGNIPFLSISDMTNQGKYIRSTSNKISQKGLDNSSSWIVPVNSIIYSMYASVGVVSINKIPIATSQAVLNLKLKDNVDLDFIYYQLIFMQNQIAKFITTGTQGNLNAQSVKDFDLLIPSLIEQKRISSLLSRLDDKIDVEKNSLKRYENQKKYILSKLFI